MTDTVIVKTSTMNSVISKKPNVAAKVRTIFHEKLGVEDAALVDTASFSDDLGLDSLDVLETFMALEKEFNLKISDEDAEKLRTVGSVIDYITEHTR
jgi:acyl carrier protein